MKAKTKTGAARNKASSKKAGTKKPVAKKTSGKKSSKKVVVVKATKKKATTKKIAAKKTTTKKTATKKTPTKKAALKLGKGVKLTAQSIMAKRAQAKKAEAKRDAAKKATSKKTSTKKASAKKVARKTVKKVVKKVAIVSAKSTGKKEASTKTATKTKAQVAVGEKTPLAPTATPKQRSQPVEVQEIDVRSEKEKLKRLPSFRPKSYGKKPKPVPAGEILKILTKYLGKAPTFKRELKNITLVQLGMFCVFAVGGNSPKVCLEAVKRLVEAFPDWNEFRISDPLEFVEILEDLDIDNLYYRCERVLDFINDVYQDQNGVDLEFLRESDSEDRLTILDRYVSLGPALAHFLALGIQGFEGVLFHYSWARVVQRLGIVPRSGSPKVLISSFAKVFRGKDMVTAQVNLIDLGEEICLSKNQSCRNCYLVLHCKGRKI